MQLLLLEKLAYLVVSWYSRSTNF